MEPGFNISKISSKTPIAGLPGGTLGMSIHRAGEPLQIGADPVQSSRIVSSGRRCLHIVRCNCPLASGKRGLQRRFESSDADIMKIK